MRVVMDGTPLLGQRTGIGRYVEGLLSGFAALPTSPDLALTAFTTSRDRPEVPAGAWAGRRVPARALFAAWGRSGLPPVEWLTGSADVVHGTNFVLPPRRRAAGVVTVHDLAFLLHAGTVTPAVARLRALIPRLVRDADAVITPTSAVADLVGEHLPVARERVHPVAHGLDAAWSLAAPDPTLGLPSSYVLFVGSREPRKDLATLVSALHVLGAAAPTLVLAGPAGWGPQPDVPVGTVRLGYVDDHALMSAVAGASALVLPSRDEGFGLPALEALACGTPVVASDLPVLREVLGDQATYAAVGDAEAFAAALSGPPAGTPDSRRAHAAGFTWQECARRTLEVYTSAR